MGINKIVNQALETGYLTPTMEAEVGKLCEMSSELSMEEYMALDKLMGALLTGEVIAMPRKQFINVMEELVVSEVISRVAEIESTTSNLLDVGDISAYALNRLPPLYATTEEGANFQREKAKEELKVLINAQVEESISLYLDRPEFYPERQAITKIAEPNTVFQQVTQLLQSHASSYESK
jgi:Late competence development protein ComFB